MDQLSWIKDLIRAENEMEETGMVDFTAGFDPQTELKGETTKFLTELKDGFVEACSAFNQLKASSLGRIKIYGISKTDADFMLFRNGFKLIFTMKEPGKILIAFNHLGSTYIPGEEASATQNKLMDEDVLISKWGAFGNLVWTYQDQDIRLDYLVKHYLSRFTRESAK